MIKYLIILIPLFVSSLTIAQDASVATEAEIAECTGGNEFKRNLCKVEVKMDKRIYQKYLDQGFPEIKDIPKKAIEDCAGGDSSKEYRCKRKLIKKEMQKNRIAKADAFNSSVGTTLYNCVGEETGNAEGFVAKRELFVQCSEHSDQCSAKFHENEFNVVVDKSYQYTGTEEGADYFKFDSISGAVQGVTVEKTGYFTGTCTRVKRL